MKKAYNETWVENLYILRKASKWLEKGLLSTAQMDELKISFPEQFYRPGIFVKIGLFFFGTIACSFFVGFASIFFLEGGSGQSFSVLSIICSASFFFFLEYVIKNRNLFHSGVDNALLYAAASCAVAPLFLLFEDAPLSVYLIISLLVLIPATLRYADLLAAAVSFFLLFTLLANLMMKFPLGKALLPFSLMILAALVYFWVKRNKDVYYLDCQKVLEVLSLVTFYLGGNYFVVREGNASLNALNLRVSPQIAFSSIFYTFTTLIPILYITFGFKKHNRILLIIGMLTLAFSIYTYRHYFSPLTVSQELIFVGVMLIVVAAAAIRYLHVPKHGLSDEKEEERQFANLEAILVAQSLGQTPQENGIEFGGGNFGGGGAGEVY
ncbi:hypothetical protein [Dyadobacter sp. CY323]|uniref:hypothetical protein n=1 Tax=Dyadobacter sp. CY323 TaxID=2907302 RepID=UPI001F333286|nr:hypothetical protein [Dyadobacter sp. CY323]MCE6987663.1 hypothetical protein [Dyadobacter sp. CY323]